MRCSAAVLQSRVTAVWTPEHGHGGSQRQQGARLHALLRLLVGGHARGQVERQTGQVTVWHNLHKKVGELCNGRKYRVHTSKMIS